MERWGWGWLRENRRGQELWARHCTGPLDIRRFTHLRNARSFSPLDLGTGCALCLEISSFSPLLTLLESGFFLQGLETSEKSSLMPRLG